MTTTARTQPQREKLLRIGEVVRRLTEEFPDISISKIRYLEDEGLLAPRRTQGGYRLFSEDDLERLETILRLQREEFLPLRVIKDELDAPGQKERKRRRPDAARRGRGDDRRSTSCATAPGSRSTSRRSSRSSACSHRAGAVGTSAIPSPTPTSLRHARGSLATASRRATCARSGPRPRARRRCSVSSSRLHCARATTSGATQGLRELQQLARARAASCRRCSSGATCETWPRSDHRPPHDDPGGARLPDTRASASRT